MNMLNGKESVIDSRSLNEKIGILAADDQWRYRGEALTLLYKAQAQLKIAEQKISEQEKKIRELEGIASTDPLTGLLNRRGFEQFFEQEEDRAHRHNTFGSVLMLLDLDNMKQINDTYGHQAGDACLKAIAEYLRGRIRSVDAAARIGGDEFAVLLAHTDLEKSADCISEIKQAMTGLPVAWQQTTLYISASIGVKHVSDNISYEAGYRAADEILYKEKKQKKSALACSCHGKDGDDISSYKIRNLGVNPSPKESPNILTQYAPAAQEMMLSAM